MQLCHFFRHILRGFEKDSNVRTLINVKKEIKSFQNLLNKICNGIWSELDEEKIINDMAGLEKKLNKKRSMSAVQ